MGIAQIAFRGGGPRLLFRIDPNNIEWNFKILTNIQETMGGRVIQVIGATLSDLTISGDVGEQRGSTHLTSWQLAEAFFAQTAKMMDYQTRGADGLHQMGPPAVFTYGPLGINLDVYIKNIADADGQGGVSHRTGKFSYGYQLVLFIQPTGSAGVKIAGTDSHGYIDKKRQTAIANYMNRIANGIGWKFSEVYNGPGLGSGIGGEMTAGQGVQDGAQYYDYYNGGNPVGSVRQVPVRDPGHSTQPAVS